MPIWKKGFEKQVEHCRKIGKLGIQKYIEMEDYKEKTRLGGKTSALRHFNKEHQSKAGSLSRVRENRVAKELEKEYDKVFLPQEICDRICVKNGKTDFVEIKKKGKKLRAKQREFKKIVGNKYKIIYA